MRVLRKIFGIALVVTGLPLLIAGSVAWIATGHRDANGAFTAELAPIHTDGYAVVVPDVADLLDRHGAAELLSPGRLRVTVAPEPRPVVLMVMPADVARGYLDGVGRTEVAAVGFARGAQPVALATIDGTGAPAPASAARSLATGTDVVWDPATASGPLSLVIMRVDGEPELDAALTVGIRPVWLVPLARGLLLGGTVLLLAGCVVLLWRTRRELTLVVAAEQLVHFADQLQVRPRPDGEPRAIAGPAWAQDSRDLTGEFVTVPRPRFDVATDAQAREDLDSYPAGGLESPPPGTEELAFEEPWDHPADEGEQMTHAHRWDGRPADDEVGLDLSLDDEDGDPGLDEGGVVRAAATRARRWGELLRSRGRTGVPGRHAFGGTGSSVDSLPAGVEDLVPRRASYDDLPDGESPYIYTAT